MDFNSTLKWTDTPWCRGSSKFDECWFKEPEWSRARQEILWACHRIMVWPDESIYEEFLEHHTHTCMQMKQITSSVPWGLTKFGDFLGNLLFSTTIQQQTELSNFQLSGKCRKFYFKYMEQAHKLLPLSPPPDCCLHWVLIDTLNSDFSEMPNITIQSDIPLHLNSNKPSDRL